MCYLLNNYFISVRETMAQSDNYSAYFYKIPVPTGL